MFAKTLILCLLGSATLGLGEKTESNHLPKNIIVLLASGLTHGYTIDEDGGQTINGSISNDIYKPMNVFLQENMPIHGVIVTGDKRHNASQGDWSTLNIIFNEHNAEGIGNYSTSKFHSNMMNLAQEAGKLTGLISTVDITKIPATIYGDILESSKPNCSDSDQLLSVNVILGPAPVNATKEINMRKCLSNHSHYSNPKSLLLELEGWSKENKSNVLGSFPHVGHKDLKTITTAALQFLRKSENGFFLMVAIVGKDPVVNMKMTTQFLKKSVPADLLNETLVLAALVEENYKDWNTPQTNNISVVDYLPSVETSMQNKTRKVIPIKEVESNSIGTGKQSSQKTNQETREDNLMNNKTKINPKEGDTVKENKSLLITETTSSRNEPASKLGTDKDEYYSTGMMSMYFSVNVGASSYSPTVSTLATEFEVHSDVQTSSSPLTSTEVKSSLSFETTVTISEESTYSSDSVEDNVLSTSDSGLLEEKEDLQNVTEKDVESPVTSRKKREAQLGKRKGILFYASGPGSRLFNGTLWPHDVRRLLKIFISTSCETAKAADLKELLASNCSENSKLSDISALSSSALMWSENNFICLGIAVAYTLVIMSL